MWFKAKNFAGIALVVGTGMVSVAIAQPAQTAPATAPAIPVEAAAPAQEQAKVTFSKLLFRIEQDDEIGVAKQDFRVFILEELRKLGFQAVGAENLLFERDDSGDADYVLGGTIQEIECRENDKKVVVACYLGIEWQLLDARRDDVVYRVLMRHAERSLDKRKSTATFGKRLVLGSLRKVVKRKGLAALLRSPAPMRQASKPNYPPATLLRCARAPIALPADADKAIAATVMIESKGAVGSGFLVTADGFVLTAAHVVQDAHPIITLRDGSKYTANLIRHVHDYDVALLRIADKAPLPCLPLALDSTKVGSEVYAVGAPAGKQLAFSLTRGIVSGLRDFDGVEHVQTDASISPGNSGGPLVDATGRAVGVVSWKVAGRAVEGIAFGVPAAIALNGLSLSIGDRSDPALLTALAAVPGARHSEVVADTAQPRPSLDPKRDRERAKAARDAERDRRIAEITPLHVKLLRWGGVTLVGVGAIGVIVSYIGHNDGGGDVTHADYESSRLVNDLSWVAVAVGAGSFITAQVLQPSLEDVPAGAKSATPGIQLALGVDGLRITGRY